MATSYVPITTVWRPNDFGGVTKCVVAKCPRPDGIEVETWGCSKKSVRHLMFLLKKCGCGLYHKPDSEKTSQLPITSFLAKDVNEEQEQKRIFKVCLEPYLEEGKWVVVSGGKLIGLFDDAVVASEVTKNRVCYITQV